MSQLDKLFADKLTNHAMTAPAGAWEKLEAGLSKKNKTAWIRWAAILLLGGLWLGALWFREEESALPMAKEEAAPPFKSEKLILPLVVSPAGEENTLAKNQIRQKRINKPGTPLPGELKPIHQNEVMPPLQEETVNLTAQVERMAEETSKPIVLTYTLDPVETTKAETAPPVVPVTARKKEKSLRRMMTFAKSVKNGDTPLMGLSDMKEELFALEFKKKTTKKQ